MDDDGDDDDPERSFLYQPASIDMEAQSSFIQKPLSERQNNETWKGNKQANWYIRRMYFILG